MVTAIQNENIDSMDINTLDITNSDLINNLTLNKLVTKNSKKFFTILNISSNFLNADPSTWENRDDYRLNCEIIKKLQVINDRAERCVALMSEYNLLLTQDEKKKQAIVKIVKEFREHFDSFNKESLKKDLLEYYIFNKKEE